LKNGNLEKSSHMDSSTHAIITVTTTVKATRAPDTRNSVDPFAAVGTGAGVALVVERVEPDKVVEVNVDNLLEALDVKLDCKDEILDIWDEALEVIEEIAEEAPALIEEAVKIAPEASDEVTEARDEAAELAPEVSETVALERAAEIDAVLSGATIVTDDPETTVTKVVEPLAAVAVPVEGVVTVVVPVTMPVTVFVAVSADCELSSDANAELKIDRALVVPGAAAVAAEDPEEVAPTAPATVPAPVPVTAVDPEGLVAPLAGETGELAVATGTTRLIPVVVNETLPLCAERTEFTLVSTDESTEAALLIPDEMTAPGADSVIVIVATIDGWPDHTGKLTLVT
jgi:hypothetical protein